MTKLRLLVDECVEGLLVQEIRSCSGTTSVEVIDANHPLGNRGTPDKVVMKYANQQERILVTDETRLDEKSNPICTHPGIIVIGARKRHELEKAKLFPRFMKSGFRKECHHAVTKLRLTGSVILRQAADGSIEQIRIELPQ